MEPDDIASLFFGDEASAPEQAAAMARALRGQQQMGQLGLLTGDKVLGNLGAHMLQGAGAREGLIAKAGTQLNQQRLQLAMAKQEQDAAYQREQYSQGQQDYRQRQMLDRSKFVQGPFGVLNTGTGELDPYAKPEKPMSEKDTNEQLEQMRKAISRTAGRGGLNPQLQNRLFASERVKNAILDENGKVKDLTPQMIAEAAAGTAALISNGSPGEHTIAQFMPNGRSMKSAELEQWLTNEPRGAGQQAFLQQLVDLSNREEKLIGQQINENVLRELPRFSGLGRGEKTKATYQSMLKAAGIDPASVDENGLPVAKPEAVSSSAGGSKVIKNGKTYVQKPNGKWAVQE